MIKALFAFLVLAPLLGCSRQGGDFASVQWTVMGTVASVSVRRGDCVAVRDVVKGAFSEVERLLNAHDAGSEISKLAALADDEVIQNCSALVRPCYKTAFDMARLSGNAFNPRWRGGMTLDLGAIAKGFAVDVASERLKESGLSDSCEILIDLGGNLKSVSGVWAVGVYGSSERIELKPLNAVATSGEYFRGSHIKDARTGKKPAHPPVSVTVFHPSSAMLADALSTVMFIFGAEDGTRFLRTEFKDCRAVWALE